MKTKTIAKPKNRDRTEWRDTYYHKLFGLKAAKEAGRVLPLFEKECPNDDRPRQAIDAIKAWAEGRRELGMAEVRKLSLGSHAAARETKSDTARYAARAAGQAIATWHVPTHAMGASLYAGKAIVENKVERLWTWFTTSHRGHRAYSYRQTRIRKHPV